MQGRVVAVVEPEPAQAPVYRELLGIYRDLYPALRGIFARLAASRARTDG